MYPSIQHYMTASPRFIGADETVGRARQLMQAFSLRHLPVLEGERLVGVVTERDIRMLEGTGASATTTRVRDAMTPEPYSVDVHAPIAKVAQCMADRKIGAAIVTDDGKVVGIFSTVDALRLLAEIFDEYFSAPTSDRWGAVVSEPRVDR